jgi:hypothetical protein
MIVVAVLILVMVLGAAAALGWTPDTRDPEHGLGPFFHPRRGKRRG